MANKFPENLPAKGTGKVDSQHRVAVLTEPEIQALNFLKNMDRSMGFKSGFSPMMQNLADQNTEPLDYVEYRGERIPSLNDFSEGGYGGGGDRGSDAGEKDASGNYNTSDNTGNYWDTPAGKKEAARIARDKAAREKTAREAAEKAEREEKARKEEKKRIDHQRLLQEVERRFEAIKAREQSTYTGQDSEELDYEAQENEDLNLDGSDIDSSGEGGSDPAFDQELNYDERGDTFDDELEGFGGDDFDDSLEGYTQEEIDAMNRDDPDRQPDDDVDDRMTDEEFNALAAELGETPQFEAKDGEMYWTQGEADMVNARFDTARDTALGTLTDFGSDKYGTDYMSGLSENYRGEFADERQTAYDAALEGVYDDFKLSGVWDQTAYDESLAAVDAGVLADNALLDPGATAYSDLAQGEFDTWLAAQTAEVQELYGGTDLSALSEWKFDVEGAEDDEGNITNVGLDLSAYDPKSDNYNADLMDLEGQDFNFLEEFKRIYPSGTTAPGVTGDAGASGVDEPTGRSSVRKTKKAKSKVPTYTSSPFGSGGSSSTIN